MRIGHTGFLFIYLFFGHDFQRNISNLRGFWSIQGGKKLTALVARSIFSALLRQPLIKVNVYSLSRLYLLFKHTFAFSLLNRHLET